YELTYASDKDEAIDATMMHAKVSVDVPGMGHVVGTYHADEAGYDALDYNKHSNTGLMDIHEWGGREGEGLTYYTVGYIHSLNDSSAVGVMYSDFSKANDDKLGTEIDAYASHKYNDVLVATVRYGKYTPETGDASDQWMLGLSLNF
ncbi:MAG: hypothetical protein HAW60_04705, partial [Bdellovibrionales bacterium]|nr:hypothetical protein [Bdellovibrionales bacterium]